MSEIANGIQTRAAEQWVAGISVVRDARDIIPFLCGHYLRLGFNRLVFVDDGSSDGTYEFLQRLSRRDRRVTVRQVDLTDFEQPMLMSDMANALIGKGCRIVFPFDKDEFWNVEVAAIRRVARGAPAGLFEAKWVQFVQDRSVTAPRFLNILKVGYRAPVLDARKKQLLRDGKPRLAFTMPKVAFKSDRPVTIEFGQHRLVEGPTGRLATGLELFHLHLRSAREIEWRKSTADRFRKLLAVITPGVNELPAPAKAARVAHFIGNWEGNSADSDGCLVGDNGATVPLVPDRRLRWLLLKAWIYMALHHPVLLFR